MDILENMDYFKSLVVELSHLPSETEWVELKKNNTNPQEIGEYISALSNSAALMGKVNAYMIWGIDDDTVGTKARKYLPWWA